MSIEIGNFIIPQGRSVYARVWPYKSYYENAFKKILSLAEHRSVNSKKV